MHTNQKPRAAAWAVLFCALCLLGASPPWAQEPPPLDDELEGQQSYGADKMGQPVIQFDPETGSLIVIADEETNRRIGEIVASLDRPVPQVLIKVLFLEVTHTNDLDLGIEGFLQDIDTGAGGVVNRSLIGETLFGVAGQTTGGFINLMGNDLGATLHALAEVGKLEVLSRPSILARHNQEATITIGLEVPFVRNTRITQNGEIINTIEYEDIGIILQVTPRITSDGWVDMLVIPEISTLTGETVLISGEASAPVFAKRSAETRVVVPDGRTVVIGGLMEDQVTETVRKVPLLGSIPLLGFAFRRTIKTKSKTELLIFLTPHIVEGHYQLRDMSIREKQNSVLLPKAFSDEELTRYIDNLGEDEPTAPGNFDMNLMRQRVRGGAPENSSSEPGQKKEALEESESQEKTGNAGVIYRNPENPPERKPNRRGAR